MEYHIVYREGPKTPVERRGYQRVQVDRLALFATYEEARLYIQICALVDRNAYGRGKNGEYRACALPFDMPLDEYTRIIEKNWNAGWKLEYSPYYSAFCDPLQFDGDGQPTFHRHRGIHGFETRTERNFCAQLCIGETPQFNAGDIVFLRWNYGPDTFAVITGLGTQAGPVRRLENNDVWTGWYHVLYWNDGGGVGEECVHIAFDFGIEPVGELPQHVGILEILARHFGGERSLPESIVNRITHEPVLVEDTEVFPFNLFEDTTGSTSAPAPTFNEVTTSAAMLAPTSVGDVVIVPENRLVQRPTFQNVFVVLSMILEYNLGKVPGDVFSLHAPHAAYSSLEQAQACVALRCSERLRLDTEDEASGRRLMSQRHRDKSPVDVDPDGNIFYCDRIQIVELLMPIETIEALVDEDRVQSLAFESLVKHTWCYNVDGVILWELPDPTLEKISFERYAFEGRFKVGDMVYVVPQALDPESESIEGDIAVVSKVPISKEAWLASGREWDAWNPLYTVDFLDPDDYLQHFHIPESSLLRADFPMRENLAFLPLWSKHLRGELVFPDGLADRIRARTVLLRKCPRYDFDTGNILD